MSGRSYQFGLADRLRAAREIAGLGQADLAEASGTSRSSVQNYEAGTTKPHRPQLISWAMATGFSWRWLETAEEDGGPDGGGQAVRREGIEPPTR